KADIILWCVEVGQTFEPADESRLAATGAVVLRVRTKVDLDEPRGSSPRATAIPSSALSPGGTDALRAALSEAVASLVRSPLAPSQSRCRHHVDACIRDLQQAHRHVLFDDPAELTALALRGALDQLGEMVGAVYTNDL